MKIEENISFIKEAGLKEKKALAELNSLSLSLSNAEGEEKNVILNQIIKLKKYLSDINNSILAPLEECVFNAPLPKRTLFSKDEANLKKEADLPTFPKRNFDKRQIRKLERDGKVPELEKEVIKRLKKKEEKENKKEEEKSRTYFEFANRLFGNTAKNLVKQKKLRSLTEDLIKSNLEYTSITYLSIFFLNTILAFVVAFFIFLFFLFFNISSELPIVSLATEGIGKRLLKVFWILILIPGATALFMRFFPSLEKRSVEGKINAELPFAAIHMAAISGSMINPINIFKIVSSTKEYPHLEKEFNKLLNEINIYGYDLVGALKDLAKDCPSQKLAELFNGLATTITSGGNLYEFFEKRAQTLLFEYKLDKEKSTKAAESFMDMYISMVVAAPMILMLLLMMMKLSGLGISLGANLITLLVTGGVMVINVFFLIFLQIKHPNNQ
jgi:Flp pilus assembly protein TadB